MWPFIFLFCAMTIITLPGAAVASPEPGWNKADVGRRVASHPRVRTFSRCILQRSKGAGRVLVEAEDAPVGETWRVSLSVADSYNKWGVMPILNVRHKNKVVYAELGKYDQPLSRAQRFDFASEGSMAWWDRLGCVL